MLFADSSIDAGRKEQYKRGLRLATQQSLRRQKTLARQGRGREKRLAKARAISSVSTNGGNDSKQPNKSHKPYQKRERGAVERIIIITQISS